MISLYKMQNNEGDLYECSLSFGPGPLLLVKRPESPRKVMTTEAWSVSISQPLIFFPDDFLSQTSAESWHG